MVVDNVSVYNEVVLCCILVRKNIILVKLFVYSYDLNFIEMVFGFVKVIVCFFFGLCW